MQQEISLLCRGNFLLSVKGGNLSITHKKESETIPISNVQSFSLKKPGLMGIGTITIKTAQSATAGVSVGFGLLLAGGAERVLNFDSSEMQTALDIQDYISHYQSSSNATNSQRSESMCVPVADEIRKLKELLDEGILTQEEFSAKKKQLLGI